MSWEILKKKQMVSRDDMSGVECDFRGAPMIVAACRIGDYQWLSRLSTICVVKPQAQKGVPLGCGNFRCLYPGDLFTTNTMVNKWSPNKFCGKIKLDGLKVGPVILRN